MSLSLEMITTSRPLLHAAAGQRTDHVVGFKIRIFEHRDPHRLQNFADPGNLLQQIGRSLGTGGFVRFKDLIAEGGAFAFKDRGEVIGLVLGPKLPDHVVENVHRLCGKPGSSPHGGRSGPGSSMVGPKNEPKGINEEEPRHLPYGI